MIQESILQDSSQVQAQNCQNFLQPRYQDSPGCKKVSSSNLHDLLKATTKFPQIRAVDFINISNFACEKIDSKNINLSLF